MPRPIHLQVANDAAFRDPAIDETTLTAPQLTTDKLVLGNYFWRVATIIEQADGSDQGSHGDPQSLVLLKTVQLHKIADVGDGDLSFRSPTEPQKKFVVEIGRDISFSPFLLTQETSTPEITVPRPTHRYLFHPRPGDRFR